MTKKKALKNTKSVRANRRNPKSIVLSVRLPCDIYDELVSWSEQCGKDIGTLLRELIEEGLETYDSSLRGLPPTPWTTP